MLLECLYPAHHFSSRLFLTVVKLIRLQKS